MSDDDFVTFHSCKCHSPWCPDCQIAYGWKLRNALEAKGDIFKDVAMLTLTIDPKHFSSPEEAFLAVSRGFGRGKVSAIAELLRAFRISNWEKVLEFQRNGFPHWHILIDVSDCPECWILPDGTKVVAPRLGSSERWNKWAMERFYKKISVPGARLYSPHYLDMEAVRRKWDGWGFGRQVNLRTKPRQSGKCGFRYALNYITKYIMKPNKNPIPSWVLANSRIRRFSCSSSIGRILMKSGGAVADDPSFSDSGFKFELERFNEILEQEKERIAEDYEGYWNYGSAAESMERKARFLAGCEVRARNAASAKYYRERVLNLLHRQVVEHRKEYSTARPIGVKVSACALSTMVRDSRGDVLCRLGFSVSDLERMIPLESKTVASPVYGKFDRKGIDWFSDSGRKLYWLAFDCNYRSEVIKLEKRRVIEGMLARAEKLGCIPLVRGWIVNNDSSVLRSLAVV